MADYSKQILNVKKIMKKKGSKIKLLRFQDSFSDSVAWNSPNISSPKPSYEVEVYGVFLHERGEKLGSYGVFNNDVLRSELVFMVEPTGELLSEFKFAEVKGIRYGIVGVDYLKPADDIILYFFGAKR